MKHILRYSLVALFTLMSSFSFADSTVTIDFNADGLKMFDGITAVSTNSSNDGDFTEDKTATVDGVTITVSKSTASTANRMWGTKAGAQLRIYGGTLKLSASKKITKAVFSTGSKWLGVSASTGTLTDKTWTSDGVNEVTFTVENAKGNQAQINKIELTLSDNSNPYAAPTISGETSFTESTTVTLTAGDGATIYYTTNGQDPDDREGTLYKEPFTLTESATVKAIAFYGDNASAVTSKDFTKLAKIETEGEGTEASPYTVSDIVKLNAGNQLPKTAYVKGTVSKVSETINEEYGQLTYWLATPNTNDTLEVYSGYYLNGEKFTSADQLKVGDVVVVNGNLSVYNGTLEFNYRSTIVSINGVTTGINSAKISAEDENAPVFNLAGQRVSHNYKGVVIKNGKKLLQK